jgi:hypothetical protein
MQPNIKDIYEKGRFLIKIPFILMLVTIGFIFEFLISIPLLILCELDNRVRNRNSGSRLKKIL